MDISILNERIMIERNEAHMDAVGNHVNEWTEYFSCAAYAAATAYQQREQQKAGIIVGEHGIVFTVRWCSELADLDATHFRVIFRGEIYNITSVDIPNYCKIQRNIKISCEQQRLQPAASEPDGGGG